MKIKQLLPAAILCVQISSAVPHGINHQHLHQRIHKRAVETAYSTVTEIVTITKPNAIVWVDTAGNPVRTEYQTADASTSSTAILSTTAITTSSPPTVTSISSTSASSVSSVSIAPLTSSSDQQNDRVGATTSSSNIVSSVEAVTSLATSLSASASNKAAASTNVAATIPGFGIDYDAWDGSACRSTLDSDFAFLASQGASKLRVYDVCFSQAVNAAAAHGLKLMIGITTFQHLVNDLNDLITEVTSTTPSWSVVDTVFIGNELVNDGLATSSDVAGAVSSARGTLQSRGFTGSVVAVDTWTAMRADPVICSTSDYCAANAHAYFDGNTLPEDAGTFVRMAQNAVGAKNPGKRVVITESGWPHAGAAMGVAVPSVDNQRTAMASIVKEFSADPADIFLFMAYDATYKTSSLVEQSFGIFDSTVWNGAI